MFARSTRDRRRGARDVLATPVNVKRVPIPRPMTGRATRYAGVDFRSRLEARWARMFDALGWRWQYEPDLNTPGYIPDFLLLGERPVIVEVGALTSRREYERKAAKGLERHPRYDYLVLGLAAIPAFDPGAEPTAGLMSEVSMLTGLEPARWHKCGECDKIAVHHSGGSLQSRPCGHDATLFPEAGAVEKTWRRVGNAAQWRPR